MQWDSIFELQIWEGVAATQVIESMADPRTRRRLVERVVLETLP